MPERAQYIAGTPSWIDLTAIDLEPTKAFYGAVFGWDFETAPEEFGFYTTCRKDGHAVAAIMPRQPGTDDAQMWNTYLDTKDIDATIQTARDAGATVVFGPMDVPEQGRVAYLIDPTGARVALWQAGGFAGAELVNEPDSLSWNELHTPDGAAADDFYKKLFAYELEQIPGGINYTLLKVDGNMVAGRFESESEPAHWLVYFSVADADESGRRVTEHGGKVIREVEDTPFGRMGTFADPTGAQFALNVLPPPQ